jgi:hypothetical protein
MKNTNNAKPTLALRAHSIRNLTPAELRVAQGGNAHASGPSTDPSKATTTTTMAR